MSDTMACCLCGEPIEFWQHWFGHQRLNVRWHQTHGTNPPIRGEDVSNHTLIFGHPVDPPHSLRARLTAFARDCVTHGDMTPAAERMLARILEETK